MIRPVLFTHWKIDQLSGLTDEAERARDGIVEFLGMLDVTAARFEDKRAAAQAR